MKVVPIDEAAPQLGKLFTDVLNGEAVFLTNGIVKVQLSPAASDADDDAAADELEALLLEGLEGDPVPYSSSEMREACWEAVRKRKGL